MAVTILQNIPCIDLHDIIFTLCKCSQYANISAKKQYNTYFSSMFMFGSRSQSGVSLPKTRGHSPSYVAQSYSDNTSTH